MHRPEQKCYLIDNCIHLLMDTRKCTELYDVWETVGALTEVTEYADPEWIVAFLRK